MPRDVAYRHAAWDTPWWVHGSRHGGRYNRPGDPPTQYWCLHPLGPSAELLRALGPDAIGDLDETRLRLWAARVDIDSLVKVDFDNAGDFGVSADALVGEHYTPTRELADRLRQQNVSGFLAPSAALPGTNVLVLFGARLRFPYLLDPLDPEDQVPTAHVTEGIPAAEVVDAVRWSGSPHWALQEWKRTGTLPSWQDPPVTR